MTRKSVAVSNATQKFACVIKTRRHLKACDVHLIIEDMTSKRKRNLQLAAVASAIFIFLAASYINAFFTGTVLDVYNPATGKRSALIRRESSFLDTAVFLYVYDPQVSKRWINLGHAGDEGFQGYAEAVWSRDGSVIATRRKVYGDGVGGSQKNHGVLWTHFYDFQDRNDALSFSNSSQHQRSHEIAKLLQSRGGIGEEINTDDEKFRTPWLWEQFPDEYEE